MIMTTDPSFKCMVIVNNSINSNKNYISPQMIEHKKAMTYSDGNPGPG